MRFNPSLRFVFACLFFVLALSAIAPPAQAGCALNDLQAVEDGYSFRIKHSALSQVDLENITVLRIWDPKFGTSFVEGRARIILRDVVLFETQQTLRYTPLSTTEISIGRLTTSTGSGFGCGAAEFPLGCDLVWCAGTPYCLPGDGPGGFVCTCQ